jgi:hypothetical protein
VPIDRRGAVDAAAFDADPNGSNPVSAGTED